ncbi:MAG: PQ-loop domain-containing transporter [Acidimicrobiia bacterium]|nr:PQ-loop domain-containing transporter [Acidimicrobiia bacterium]
MLIADSAAVLATLLAFVTLVPQVMKLWNTRNADGVSTTWASLGMVSNAAWTAYLYSQDLWLALPSTTSMVLFYTLTIGLIAWTGRPIARAVMLGSSWALILTLVGVIGGWAGLGVLLGVSFGVQATPSLWTAFRTWAPKGISPGTWQLTLVEGLLWLVYGAAYSDRAIVMFGILSSAASSLMVARYYMTRRRWLEPAHARSLRSP